MNREESIKICKQVRKYFKGGKLAIDDTDAIYKALTNAIEALKAQSINLDDVSTAYENGYQQAKFEAQQWILCSERLPKEDKNVLVTVHFHGSKNTHSIGCYYVEVANQIGGEWCSYSDEYKVEKDRHEVIAWMPLPKPYEGKS